MASYIAVTQKLRGWGGVRIVLRVRAFCHNLVSR